MHILLFGKSGPLGWELQRAQVPQGRITAVDFDSTNYCGDFSNPACVTETVHLVKPDVILNAAAHTVVDKFAERPNATSLAAIANYAELLGTWLVHYSTDYVFGDHFERHWVENDETAPLNVYGKTKLVGEQRATQCSHHLIFRTTRIYAARGPNFAKTMLCFGKKHSDMSITNDQFNRQDMY